MSLPCPLKYSAEGAWRGQRRIMNHATKPAMSAIPTTPPITPPAIAPVFELLLEGDEGVIVDWLLVELGTLKALPVTSGESVTGPIIHMRCGSLAQIRTADTLRQCFIPGIGLRVQ